MYCIYCEAGSILLPHVRVSPRFGTPCPSLRPTGKSMHGTQGHCPCRSEVRHTVEPYTVLRYKLFWPDLEGVPHACGGESRLETRDSPPHGYQGYQGTQFVSRLAKPEKTSRNSQQRWQHIPLGADIWLRGCVRNPMHCNELCRNLQIGLKQLHVAKLLAQRGLHEPQSNN